MVFTLPIEELSKVFRSCFDYGFVLLILCFVSWCLEWIFVSTVLCLVLSSANFSCGVFFTCFETVYALVQLLGLHVSTLTLCLWSLFLQGGGTVTGDRSLCVLALETMWIIAPPPDDHPGTRDSGHSPSRSRHRRVSVRRSRSSITLPVETPRKNTSNRFLESCS